MTTASVQLASLANGTILTQAGNSGPTFPAVAHQVFVYQRDTTTQVQVYSDEGLTITASQPLATTTAGAVPGYVAGGQAIDFFDSTTSTRRQADPLGASSVATASWRSNPTTSDLPIYTPADFGAKGDNVTDDSAAWSSLITRINAQTNPGALILLPPGFRSKCLSGVTFDSMTGVRILGQSPPNASTSSCEIWTGRNDGGPAISAKSTVGFSLDGVWVRHNGSTSQAATALDLTSAQFPDLRRCAISAQTSSGTLVDLVTMKGVISGKLDHVFFNGGRYNVQGRSLVGDFLNSLDIDGCYFQNADLCALHNLGAGTEIHGGTVFEPLRSGAAGALLQDSTIPVQGLSINGAWSGDGTVSGTLFIVNGTGISIRGSKLDGGSGAGTAVQFNAASSGVEIKGNDIRNWTLGIDKNGQTVTAEIGPNAYASVSTHHNFTAAGTLYVEA